MNIVCWVGIVIHLVCFVWVIYKLRSAPEGVEIPRVGFVEIKK